jgi:hypothetical protein
MNKSSIWIFWEALFQHLDCFIFLEERDGYCVFFQVGELSVGLVKIKKERLKKDSPCNILERLSPIWVGEYFEEELLTSKHETIRHNCCSLKVPLLQIPDFYPHSLFLPGDVWTEKYCKEIVSEYIKDEWERNGTIISSTDIIKGKYSEYTWLLDSLPFYFYTCAPHIPTE